MKQEVEQEDNSKYEISKKQMRLQIKELKKGLEQITKHFNGVSSSIVKKRSQINVMRKERTLYDHIFKTLEYQILGQEKQVYDLIEENHDKDNVIKESEANLANIVELVSRNKYEDFYKIIEEEKKKYMEDLLSLKTDTKEDNHIYKEIKIQPMFNFSKKATTNNDANIDRLATKTKEEDEIYEELFTEFRLYTVDEDLDLIERYITNGDELNENLYQEFVDMENQYEDLRREYESMTQVFEKQEDQTVTTALTKTKQLDDYENDFNDTNASLNSLIVI